VPRSRSPYGVLPAQCGVALFPEKRMIRHRPAYLIRHPIGEATPELEHLRAGAAP
jgi:hypothetical protein